MKSEPDWESFRSQMPVAERYAYFDHAAVAPLTRRAQQQLTAWATDMAEHGDVHWLNWAAGAETARQRLARLLGAETAEVALLRNTTEGLSLVAEGFPWRAGDNVVVPCDEFPSNLYPWMNLESRGVELRRVAAGPSGVELADIDAACDARTRIVAASWVGYASGRRQQLDDLAEIAHRHGAWLCLDAIQGLGVFPLDVRRTPVDVLAADGHKWLLGPEGAGVLYLRREHLDTLRPVGLGWSSVAHAQDFSHIELNLKPSAARFEGGTLALGCFAALGESVQLLLDYGVEAVSRRLLDVTDQIVEGLERLGATVVSPRAGDCSSGIVSYTLPQMPAAEARRRALLQQVVLSCRGGRIRISPHVYTNEHDIARLLTALSVVDA